MILYNYRKRKRKREKTMDRRKNYYLTLDTETTNSLDDALVYDIGGAIHDKKGNIKEKFSFVITDIFCQNGLMESAYYKEKIPRYEEQLIKGERTKVTFFKARKHILNLMKKYNVKAVVAYNARFDLNALNTTIRYLTKSKYRYFFPYGTTIYDSLKMTRDTIGKQKSYYDFCHKNGFLTKHRTPQLQMKAETVYRYMTNDINFIESHTGLEDVMIEIQIFARCIRQHKKMRTLLYG